MKAEVKLSERLEAAVERLYEDGMDTRGIADLLRESAELARRVEGAPCAVAGQSPGRFYYAGGSASVEHGQRVRIVPEQGEGEP